MAYKYQKYTYNFDEFESISLEEWLKSFQASTSRLSTPTDAHHPRVSYAAINTDHKIPTEDKARKLTPQMNVCTLEVPLRKPNELDELRTWIEGGVTGLNVPETTIGEVRQLLSVLDHPLKLLSIEAREAESKGVADYVDYRRLAYQTGRVLSGSVYLSTAQFSYWKKTLPNFETLARLIGDITEMPSVRVLTLPGDTFHNLGMTAVDELATVICWLTCYFDRLTDEGVSIQELMTRTEITLATGGDFFLDLAKFRAIRVLLDKVGQAYGHREASPAIRAVSGKLNKTLYDPDSNILRNTTEALAALLGGVDTLALLPHDFLYPTSDQFGRRLVTHLFSILQDEAHLGKVYDPAGGSHFLEDITRQLVEKSWTLFLDFEDRGGFEKLLTSGFIESLGRESLEKQFLGVRTQTKVLTGATRYTNRSETVNISFPKEARLAAPFERIRSMVDRRVAQGYERPELLLIVQDEKTSSPVINQRAHYIRDLLTSVGLAYRVHTIRASESSSLNLPLTHQSGLVFCGTNAFYESTVTELLRSGQYESLPCWVAGGHAAINEAVQQAGGKGTLGIGYDVILPLEQLVKHLLHET